MHFVDNVDLVARRSRTVMHRFDNFTDIANARARSGVHFHDVYMTPFHNRHAVFADATGFSGRTTSSIRTNAIDALSDNSRGCGFTCAANTRHHKCLRDAVRFEGVLERAHHRLLANKIGKGFGAIFAR